MDESEKAYHIYRLLCGYTKVEVNNTEYIIDTPTSKTLYESFYQYRKEINNNKFDDILSAEKAELVLIQQKQWTFRDNDNLKELDKSLEEAKLALYESYKENESLYIKARKHLKLVKEKRLEKLYIKHSLDDTTLEGLASQVQELYIFSNLLLNNNYEKVVVDGNLLKSIIRKYRGEILDSSKQRELARCDEWQTIWGLQGLSAFRVIGDEQRMLIGFSKMYDNATQVSDPPSEEIINDDDLFDGWMIFYKKKIKKENEPQEEVRLKHKHKSSGEIIVPIESHKREYKGGFSYFGQQKTEEEINSEIKKVIDMNDVRGKVIQGKIHKAVDAKGSVGDLGISELALEHKLKGLKNG